MREVCVSAPGKIILHGEHAVVYGKLALAASLNLRTTLHLAPQTGNTLTLQLPDVHFNCSWPLDTLQALHADEVKPLTVSAPTAEQVGVLQALAKSLVPAQADGAQTMAVVALLFLYSRIAGLKSVKITVSSQLPIGAGLGSSAAYAVCVSAGLLLAVGAIRSSHHAFDASTQELVNSWAFEAEKLIHGNPSGIDNALSSFGGARRFAQGTSEPLEKMPQLRIVLVNTKIPRSTKALVARVREHHTLVPEVVDAILDATEKLAKEAEKNYAQLYSIQHGAQAEKSEAEIYRTLAYLIDANQSLLCAMGVGHVVLDTVCEIAHVHGLHAKLTGAGGGGCAWLLIPHDSVHEKVQGVLAALTEQNFAVWETSMGGPGVTEDPLPQ